MDHASINDGPPGHRVPRDSGAPTTVYRQWPVGRRDLQPFAVKSADHGVVGVAELCRLFGDGVEHDVEVGRLRGDHTQDLGGCRLLLQGLGQHSLGPNRSFGGGGLPLLPLRRASPRAARSSRRDRPPSRPPRLPCPAARRRQDSTKGEGGACDRGHTSQAGEAGKGVQMAWVEWYCPSARSHRCSAGPPPSLTSHDWPKQPKPPALRELFQVESGPWAVSVGRSGALQNSNGPENRLTCRPPPEGELRSWADWALWAVSVAI
jgi:hypothetical protein